MNGISPQVLALVFSTGVGVWMAVAGVQKSVLEWKRPKRTFLREALRDSR